MKAIVYVTNTGSSEKYAQMLGEKTGIAVYPFSKSDEVSEGAKVIFIGWVMAGTVQGLAEARQKFGELYAVCPVGMMKSEKNNGELKQKNAITEPMFFLQGDFHIDRLKGMYKMMMGMMMKMMKSKLNELEGDKGKQMLELFEKGVDFVSEDNLGDIVAWLGEGE